MQQLRSIAGPESTAEIDSAIAEAEAELAKDGVLLDAREVLAALRRKHFGQSRHGKVR